MRTILPIADIAQLKPYIGEELFNRLRSSRHICSAPDKFSYFIMFRYTDIRKEQHKDDPVCIYCGQTELFFVSDNTNCIRLLNSVDASEDSFTQLLEFFYLLTADDLDELGRLEDKITGLEDRLLSENRPSRKSRGEIITLRRKLLSMKRYYEQLRVITGEFSEDINDVIPRALQKRYISLNRRIKNLLDSVMHLREYITQVREAYQAQIDIEQNQIMKVFTVITAIFLPLSLIVGWYGMNFPMPEFSWKYGYPFVIVLSVCVAVFCLILFARKKWLK